ncbi:hypothetical protein JHK86_022396 [Glycine max]|nr:hypothetical protein JHK86_022396 [Glycine max]
MGQHRYNMKKDSREARSSARNVVRAVYETQKGPFSRLDSKSSLERFTRAAIRIDASGSPNLFIHLLAARFSNFITVHIDERLSVSIPAHLGRRRTSGNSSVKLHYVNDKHGSASDHSDLDSLCLSDYGLTALAEGFPKLEKLRQKEIPMILRMLCLGQWLVLQIY